jgi:hypothetical protein
MSFRKRQEFIHFKTTGIMLPHFTWTEYLLTVAALVIVYYVIVGITFFRQELKSFFNSKNKLWQRADKPPPAGQ